MDKYEFNIKVEQIKKLAAKKQFKEAAQIAKDMNWQKVKDWSTLAAVINVQEAAGDYLEARDMAILAYNRNLGGRKLVYKLTEILIKLEDFENADELYKEYEKSSMHDVNRFILLYHLRKAEKASDNELVEILEEYKENEIDEKYMYELAILYKKTGRKDECIKTCDDIVLWFQDGVYVEKTIELKQELGASLTNTQKKILEQTRKKQDDLEFTREIMFKEQQQIARMQTDEIDEAFIEAGDEPSYKSTDVTTGRFSTLDQDKLSGTSNLVTNGDSDSNANSEADTRDEAQFDSDQNHEDATHQNLKAGENADSDDSIERNDISDISDTEYDDDDSEYDIELEEEDDQNDSASEKKEETSEDASFGEEDEDSADLEADPFHNFSSSSMDISKGFEEEARKQESAAKQENAAKQEKQETQNSIIQNLDKEVVTQNSDDAREKVVQFNAKPATLDFKTTPEGVKKTANGIDKASVSLKELIANAKKKIEDSCEQINREQEKAMAELAEEENEIMATEPDEGDSDESDELDNKENEMNIEVKVPNFDLYDTQNIQAALAQSLSKIMQNNDEVDEAEALRPQPIIKKPESVEVQEEETYEDDQIEGQMNLADWVETVREQKYGKQHTREFSKTELDRMLDEKDEKSAAYEKLIAEQKAKAKAEGTEFNEPEARRKAQAQMMIHAAKTDLAIRTGKATVKLEEAVAQLRKEAKEAKAAQFAKQNPSQEECTVTEEQNVDSVENAQTNSDGIDEERLEQSFREVVESISLNTAPMQPITDEILSSVRQILAEQNNANNKAEYHNEEDNQLSEESDGEVQNAMNEDLVQNNTSNENEALNGNDNSSDEVVATESSMENITEPDNMQFEGSTEEQDLVDDGEEQEPDHATQKQKGRKHRKSREKEKEVAVTVGYQKDEEKKLTPELAKIFRKYREMPGLETQLVDYFDSISEEMRMTTSSIGNIIISGNSSSDKTDLARTLVRAINYLYPDQPKKIAKTTGESINHRGIAKAMNKLKGTALIVEGAGSIQPKRVNEIMNCLDQVTDRMLVIFEDSDTEMNVLLNFNPELPTKFNHRIVLKQYTVNELVEMARTFARKRQYEVDDDALLELYLKIDRLHNTNDNIKLDDIKEIINKAIIRSEKRASRRFFGGLKKKRGSNGDVFFLTEVDFKD